MADTRRTLAALQTLLADNTAGSISAQDVRDFLVSVDGENAIQSGTFASLPATAQLAGDLYLPTDGPYLLRWNGSAWASFGPMFPMTAPVNGDFAWVNQGGATVDATKGGVTLWAPADASLNWRIRKKAAPATPYVITASFIPLMLCLGTHRIGLVFRQSSDGKLSVIEYRYNGFPPLGISVSTFSSPTSYNADYTSAVKQFESTPVWFRIADDGANRIVSYSMNGQTWWQIHSVGRTDYLTADEVGFAADTNNATYGCGMTLLSWEET